MLQQSDVNVAENKKHTQNKQGGMYNIQKISTLINLGYFRNPGSLSSMMYPIVTDW